VASVPSRNFSWTLLSGAIPMPASISRFLGSHASAK
jgi:hypothetical protein